jgi:hypothetical protein
MYKNTYIILIININIILLIWFDYTCSTSKSVCASNEVAAPDPLALVQKSQGNNVSEEETKERGSNGGAAVNKGKKQSAGAASTPSTPKKHKKTSAAASSSTPSTPSKCLPATVPHDIPAMRTRSKKKERSINDVLATGFKTFYALIFCCLFTLVCWIKLMYWMRTMCCLILVKNLCTGSHYVHICD